NGRRPNASINFVTAHDGFSLADLVSYNDKHNEANGEDNRDGDSHNRSWNCGIEGETNDPNILALRDKQRRNFLSTLILSQGIPMLAGGDELGKSHHGNNNPYCQDNELTWLNWDLKTRNSQLFHFTRELIYFRRQHPTFRRRRWFQGREIHGSGVKDIGWFNPDGGEMTEAQWHDGFAKAIAIFLNGEEIMTPGPRGERIIDDSFILFFNAHYEAIDFVLPITLQEFRWQTILDTTEPVFVKNGIIYCGNQPVSVKDRSLIMLQMVK
ncbi:MAG TPA: glycogen debranching enzyme, partial [Cyanobacteria bacterium UBA11149]|nr:glycogen debranching enzyme [Cyanobacteria bacterium UBA11149]